MHFRKLNSSLQALLVAILALSVIAPQVRAQISIEAPPTYSLAELEQVMQAGDELERNARWADAVAHYERALKAHPGRSDLEHRYSVAKLHYDVSKRYADSSFIKTVDALTPQESLDFYGEVLLKIHAHYYTEPDWHQISRHGTLAIEVALRDASFRQKYQLGNDPQREEAVIQELRGLVTGEPIRSRHHARHIALTASRLVWQRLGVPSQPIILEYSCSALGALDEYSAFLTGNQLDEVLSQIEGSFVGLGIELKTEEKALLIVNVIDGGSAASGGLRPGERIIRVDGYSTDDISTDRAADMLRGPEGSVVNLDVRAVSGEVRRVELRRQRIEVPCVDRVSIVDEDKGVGYLRLTSFQKTTSRDVESAMWKLHRQGMRSLIIDVRHNPGGLLTAAVEVADKFVSAGSLLETHGRSAGENLHYKAHAIGTWRVPLVILIDGDSASASEIFAGAIRDHKRGTIVGTRSYGKGSVQGIFPLSLANAGVRLTTAKFYSPNGHAISRKGVEPDVVIRTVAKPVTEKWRAASTNQQEPEDPVFEAGVELARQQAAG